MAKRKAYIINIVLGFVLFLWITDYIGVQEMIDGSIATSRQQDLVARQFRRKSSQNASRITPCLDMLSPQ